MRGQAGNLWRALALVWLGGIASPMLIEPTPDIDAVSAEQAASDVAGASADALGAAMDRHRAQAVRATPIAAVPGDPPARDDPP